MHKDILHIPVMSQEVLEYLNLKPGAIVVDGTLGLAGHSVLMAEHIGDQGTLIGIDRDKSSIEVAKDRLHRFHGRLELVHDDYRHLDQVLTKMNILEVDAMLFDLGISSYQLDNPQRGFSFRQDGPLDMRMDQDSFISAADLVNSLSERELSNILKNFGEERLSHRIAHQLVNDRNKTPFESTHTLRESILKAVPASYQRQRIDPATRTFQAIRIAVNRELESLDCLLKKAIPFLKIGGRICVISFHSLEDRIVKMKFRELDQQKKIKILTKKPLVPTEQESYSNSRSRSARLRAAERIK